MRIMIPNVQARRVNSRDGKRSFLVQAAGLIGKDGLAQRFEVWHGEKDTPHPPGEYTIDLDNSIYVGKTGNLEIRPRLLPVEAPRAAKA